MITPKDKIGYIRRATVDGKEQFKFIEAKVKSVRIGKKEHLFTRTNSMPLMRKKLSLTPL